MKEEQASKLNLDGLDKNEGKFEGIIIVIAISLLFFLFAVLYLILFKSKSPVPYLSLMIALPITFISR
jgi:LPS O-antigen subunit length determinant protein (WzzB/FepE family)